MQHRSRIHTIVFALGALTAGSCLGPADPCVTCVEPSRQAIIYGVVSSAAGPVSGALVRIQIITETSPTATTPTDQTDAAGVYRLNVLEEPIGARWVVRVDPPATSGLLPEQEDVAPAWFLGAPTDSVELNITLVQ